MHTANVCNKNFVLCPLPSLLILELDILSKKYICIGIQIGMNICADDSTGTIHHETIIHTITQTINVLCGGSIVLS